MEAVSIRAVFAHVVFFKVSVADHCVCLCVCLPVIRFRSGIRKVILLEQIFRQKDREFAGILNAFRVGKPTEVREVVC